MNISDIKSGKREFMTLQVDENSGAKSKEYQVMINPETFEKRITASNQKPKNLSEKEGTSSEFIEMGPTIYDFSLILDGTGIVNPTRKDVKKELDDLMNVLFTKVGDGGHHPNPVIITYCHETFRCIVSSVVVKYTLFNPDGTPLRATVTCSFTSTGEFLNESDLKRTTDENEKSWFEDFAEVVSASVKNECDSLYNMLGIKW